MRKFLALVLATFAATSLTTALASSAATTYFHVRLGARLTAPRQKHHVKSYRWQHCNRHGKRCHNIAGATHRVYRVQRADMGHALRVHITVAGSKVNSHPTAVVTAAPAPPPPAPVNTALPTITGGTVQGGVLTGGLGTWQNATNFTYQWEDCDAAGANCVAIPGAAGATSNPGFAPTYKLVAGDVGHTIILSVTAFDGGAAAAAIAHSA